ncbi:Ser/Thr protein phosphatase family [Metarhizium rileyi]|uniref:Ser/Thr protein phosphatase family n=1 Tax=Metarhizium rileyi (strain RCEF 4871) TaxID=1649241 RepID=A0A167GS97_METRR|nr:Ser/Thr protein phosphatase family [Metarhizium rileyi RCEF 4871]TWU75182.1 hypothetical protein ED733_004603 [Metarhizium rileyi]
MPVFCCRGIGFVAVVIILLAVLYVNQIWEPEARAVFLGASHQHELDEPALIASLPSHHIPTIQNDRRLIVIGDIHGMNTELGKLLDRAEYDPANDHVIALGDLVNKGPDSRGVLSRLMSMNASAVRGNHEDRLLLAWKKYIDQKASPTPQSDVVDQRKRDKKILKVAKNLLPQQITWLSDLPVILKATSLSLYFVHGGLVPGVRLEEQDPWAVMNMRTLKYSRDELRRREDGARAQTGQEYTKDDDITAEKVIAVPIDDHSGERWDQAWDDYEKKHVKKSQRRSVMYGHDAKRGFTEGEYTVGLDSGCVVGGQLTGLIVRAKGNKSFSYDKIQVPCKAWKRKKT